LARILIDTLPPAAWKDELVGVQWDKSGVTLSDVKSKLIGDNNRGLLVQIRRRRRIERKSDDSTGTGEGDSKDEEEEEQRYHLFVPRMYGEVEDVKTTVKAKRLVVKLTKKRTGTIFNFYDNTNLRSWPQLPAKDSSSNSNQISTDYVNEDLFRT